MDDFFPAYLQNQKASDGKVYGLPYTGEGLILYYRTDILEKAGFDGPPKTYDELEEICKKVNTPETPCFVVRASRGRGYNPFSYPLFLYGYGGKWFNEGWNPALDSPEAAAGLEEMVKLLTKYGPKGVANYTHYEMYTDFAQGKMTLPLIYLARKLTRKDGQRIKGLFDKDREEIITLLRDYDTVEESWQTAREYLDKAKGQLELLEDSEAKEALYLLTDYLLENLNTNVKEPQIVSVLDSSQSSSDHADRKRKRR